MQHTLEEYVQVKLPEGSNCGLVKNLALSGIISVNVPSEEIVEKLYDLGTVHFFDAKEDLKKDGTRVFVDGRLIGYYKDGEELAESLRELRDEIQKFILMSESHFINLKLKAQQEDFM